MSNFVKALLAVGVITYAISPDFAPGPFDDMLVAVLGAAVMRLKSDKISNN